MRQEGQEALPTHNLLALPDIKTNKEAAAASFRAAGADTILVVRLLNQTTYTRTVAATPQVFVPLVTGYEDVGWYDYYSVAYMDMAEPIRWRLFRQLVSRRIVSICPRYLRNTGPMRPPKMRTTKHPPPPKIIRIVVRVSFCFSCLKELDGPSIGGVIRGGVSDISALFAQA